MNFGLEFTESFYLQITVSIEKNEFELTLSIIGGGFEWINWWKREFIVDSWLEKLHDFLMNGCIDDQPVFPVSEYNYVDHHYAVWRKLHFD